MIAPYDPSRNAVRSLRDLAAWQAPVAEPVLVPGLPIVDTHHHLWRRDRGDYLPAIRLFRPLAEAGNPKAQSVLGKMYRKGQGVARNPAQAFMWFSLAARRGDARARAEMREVSQAMTPQEISTANQMAQACEASNYRACEYF